MINTCNEVRNLVGTGAKLVLFKPPTTLDTTFAIVDTHGIIVNYVDIGCANECLDITLPDKNRMKSAPKEYNKYWENSPRGLPIEKIEKVWCMVM